jgi:hypothetical protein
VVETRDLMRALEEVSGRGLERSSSSGCFGPVTPSST